MRTLAIQSRELVYRRLCVFWGHPCSADFLELALRMAPERGTLRAMSQENTLQTCTLLFGCTQQYNSTHGTPYLSISHAVVPSEVYIVTLFARKPELAFGFQSVRGQVPNSGPGLGRVLGPGPKDVAERAGPNQQESDHKSTRVHARTGTDLPSRAAQIDKSAQRHFRS